MVQLPQCKVTEAWNFPNSTINEHGRNSAMEVSCLPDHLCSVRASIVDSQQMLGLNSGVRHQGKLQKFLRIHGIQKSSSALRPLITPASFFENPQRNSDYWFNEQHEA